MRGRAGGGGGGGAGRISNKSIDTSQNKALVWKEKMEIDEPIREGEGGGGGVSGGMSGGDTTWADRWEGREQTGLRWR